MGVVNCYKKRKGVGAKIWGRRFFLCAKLGFCLIMCYGRKRQMFLCLIINYIVMGISIKERLSYCLSEDISVAKAALYGLLRIAFKCEKITFKELVAKWCERVDTDRECAEDNLRYFAEQFDAVLKVRKEEVIIRIISFFICFF